MQSTLYKLCEKTVLTVDNSAITGTPLNGLILFKYQTYLLILIEEGSTTYDDLKSKVLIWQKISS